jgi:hypothetical protein
VRFSLAPWKLSLYFLGGLLSYFLSSTLSNAFDFISAFQAGITHLEIYLAVTDLCV